MTTPAVLQIDELFAGLSSLPSTATPQQPQKMRMSLDDISDLIASTPERWTRWEKDDEGKKRRKLIVPAWRACWHRVTYIAIDADTQGGYWWFDGADWHRDDHGRAIRAAMRRAVEHARVVPTRGWNDVDGIAMTPPASRNRMMV